MAEICLSCARICLKIMRRSPLVIDASPGLVSLLAILSLATGLFLVLHQRQRQIVPHQLPTRLGHCLADQ